LVRPEIRKKKKAVLKGRKLAHSSLDGNRRKLKGGLRFSKEKIPQGQTKGWFIWLTKTPAKKAFSLPGGTARRLTFEKKKMGGGGGGGGKKKNISGKGMLGGGKKVGGNHRGGDKDSGKKRKHTKGGGTADRGQIADVYTGGSPNEQPAEGTHHQQTLSSGSGINFSSWEKSLLSTRPKKGKDAEGLKPGLLPPGSELPR